MIKCTYWGLKLLIKLAIFDMDGTICDTIEDLAASCNYALKTMGFSTHPLEAYNIFVGNGVKKLIERAVPKDTEEKYILKTLNIFLDYYSEHYTVFTKPYDGMYEALNTLKQKGITLAVLTNKAHPMALKVADVLFKDIFARVEGQSEKPLKPDPTVVFEIMESFGATKEETVFIGDSDVDIITAKNAEIMSIGASWGFRGEEELKKSGACFVAKTPSDIVKFINEVE